MISRVKDTFRYILILHEPKPLMRPRHILAGDAPVESFGLAATGESVVTGLSPERAYAGSRIRLVMPMHCAMTLSGRSLGEVIKG